ncbi:MAG: TIGR02647 family protein [Gammaproteobacteria bacterium]|jgi:uncharacterized protein (TIGR02647 family)|nr:TIGR02647 family protein [Gammaproteobacteria bacterium]
MPYSADLIEEVNILARFNLSTTQEGIKIHSNAEQSTIDATQRLYDKGLITQPDGGYLTPLGHTAAEHIQGALTILTPAYH